MSGGRIDVGHNSTARTRRGPSTLWLVRSTVHTTRVHTKFRREARSSLLAGKSPPLHSFFIHCPADSPSHVTAGPPQLWRPTSGSEAMSSSASPFAAWFDAPRHADVLINVCTGTTDLEPCAKKAKTGAGSQASAAAAAAPVARSYHCHAVILSAHSGYFNAQLSSTWNQEQQPTEPEEAIASSSAAGTKRHVSVHVEAEELDAMHELLRMMYSQAPPTAAAPGEPLFLQCLILADRFQAASCTELLLTTLAAIPSEDIDCAVLGYVFQGPAGVEVSPSYPALLASSTKALVRLFGDVPEVMKDEDLLQQFCSLPYAAVLAWVQSDELQVHSENCVVFLVSAWVKANQDSTAAQHEELAHQIRVFHLGPAYQHHILPNLSWFKDCSGMKHLPVVLSCIRAGVKMKKGLAAEATAMSAGALGCPPAWMAPPRRCSNSSRTGSWVLSPSQLQELSNVIRQYLSPPVYVNGFLMLIYMKMEVATAPSAATPGKTLGVYSGISRALMERLGLPVPDNAALAMGPVNVRVGSPGSQMRKNNELGSGIVQCGRAWGKPNILLSRAQSSILEVVAPYLQEGQLHVEATFTGMDAIM